VLGPCLGNLSGVHSKPEKKNLELVELLTSSRVPKPHCSIQIVSKDSSKKLLDIQTLATRYWKEASSRHTRRNQRNTQTPTRLQN
jgi:hypothetical protein